MTLKDCPFCGSEAMIMTKTEWEGQGENYDVCCTDGNCYLCAGAGWNWTSPERAAEMWNKRSRRLERDQTLEQLGI